MCVDADLCIGSAKCANDAPEAFALDDMEIARVLPGAGDLPRDRLELIAKRCPVAAITFEEA